MRNLLQLGGMEAQFSVLVSLLGSAILGGLLGLERSIAGKHAGMRTYALVSLGSCLFTVVGILASFQFAMFTTVNPLHLAGFVIVGIGFIGAGLASLRSENHVELTTASGIWVAAGVGIAAGLGYWVLALGATVLGMVIFSALAKVEHIIRMKYGRRHEN